MNHLIPGNHLPAYTDPKFITEYWSRIGEIPESTQAINKANKKLLNDIKGQKPKMNPGSTMRKRSTESNKDHSINANKHKRTKRSP